MSRIAYRAQALSQGAQVPFWAPLHVARSARGSTLPTPTLSMEFVPVTKIIVWR